MALIVGAGLGAAFTVRAHRQSEKTASGESYAYTETAEDHENRCTLSIDCSSVLMHEDRLSDAQLAYIPGNGMILEESVIGFQTGETAFDIAVRVCGQMGIALEYNTTPLTGSSYIEGINQLYEFDCGELSGWKFSVNGEWPNIASTDYKLSDGDALVWYYTCDGVTEYTTE